MTEQSPAEAIFFAALEKGTAEERAAYLDAACGDDKNLRQRVERLLAAHPQVGSFLEPPAEGSAGAAEARTVPPAEQRPAGAALAETSYYHGPSEGVGSVIDGKYKLVEALGEGGMGAVFMAQQTQPVKRLVALKLIKRGMDSRQVLARFEAERQALALMDHPNIAKVLDAGATDSGRPFFVMELVKGVPITHFCDERQLSPRERLELFIPVCQAIQHAHQKGVIHRDLKPSNVLVALYDDRPVPKVIDFGVAKAAGSQLTDASLVTGFGAIVGTPEYMSPEQAQLNQLDIDTRSDIYALGVLLYELLTGTTPIDRKRLGQGALFEVLRIICEVEPPPPSTRLSTSEALASIAATRRTEPAKLARLMRGELDWIVMKCLEKERSRRYETANALARDLERYLHDEVVEARPPTVGYRLRKFARKHRVGLATAAAFAGLLIAAAAVSSWLAVKASRAEVLADEKRIEAEANAKEAEANRKEAWKNLELYGDAARKQADALRDLAIKTKSLQIDIDLSVIAEDPRRGVLRMARTIKDVPANPVFPGFPSGPAGLPVNTMFEISESPKLVPFREFAAAAVLAAGQDFAPLLPPITHDGHKVLSCWISPDHRTLLTFGADAMARLWDMRTARPIAILRRGAERVANCGFSLDGRTVFTDDETNMARFWEADSGRYRTRIERRGDIYAPAVDAPGESPATPATRIDRRQCILSGRDRLLTRRVVAKQRPRQPKVVDQEFAGPVELWDMATGRFVARLDRPGCSVGSFQFVGDGQWVTATDGASTVLVFAAQDGRLAGRLNHPAREAVGAIVASPSGRRIATAGFVLEGQTFLRIWDTASWTAAAPMVCQEFSVSPFAFCTDDLIVTAYMGNFFTRSAVYRYGRDEPVARSNTVVCRVLLPGGELAMAEDGRLYDTRTGKRLLPLAGRRFHPDVARFAADGRYVVGQFSEPNGQGLIDARAEKVIPTEVRWDHIAPPSNLPGFGLVTAIFEPGLFGADTKRSAPEIRLLPAADRLSLPPDLLELWAQVAVRGYLNDEGAFVKWDESTWEKKRQELAAKPAPYPDFPFPGHVARDRLHWLRQEYFAATDADKPALAKQLLARADAAGDMAEAARWRAIVAPKQNDHGGSR